MKYCFGIDIGGTTIKMGVFSEGGELFHKWEIPTRTENNGTNILMDIHESLQRKLEEFQMALSDVFAIGVGVPAAVNASGIVEQTTNLGWGYKEVKRELEELIGVPVCVENDANLAALGERWKGSGRGCKDIVMITLGTGVGAGIIVDGQLLTGAKGGAGEIGDLCVNYNESGKVENVYCGSLEYYVSATGLVRMAKSKLENKETQSILKLETVTAKEIFDAAQTGDAIAKEIVDDFASYLGRALNTLTFILEPEVFILGGGVSKAGDILLKYTSKYYQQKVPLALASLGNDAGIFGAAKLAVEKR